MHDAKTPTRKALLLEALGFIAAGGLLLLLSILTVPAIHDVHLETSQGQSAAMPLPFEWGTVRDKTSLVSFVVMLKPGKSATLRLSTNQCISEVKVRGAVVMRHPCTFVTPMLDVNPWLAGEPGANRIDVTVSAVTEASIKFDAFVSPMDPLAITLRLLRFALILSASLWILRHITADVPLLCIGAFGVVLRAIYVFGTAPNERAHDFGAHTEYLRYVAMHPLGVPPVGSGWEFFQPPLYYWLAAPMLRLGTALGWTDSTSVGLLQDGALALSACTLVACIWVGTLLFQASEARSLRLFSLLLAAFPALILFSPRVSNDPLLLLLSILALGLIILFWQRPFSPRLLYAAVTAIALGFLTKANGIGLAPVLAICFFLKPNVPTGIRRRHALGCVFVFLVLTGWYMTLRATEGHAGMERISTFGGSGVNPALAVAYTPRSFLTFHPGMLVQLPYNPVAVPYERSAFFPYFFRSALFGEFLFLRMTILAPLLMMFACLLLPWMAVGMIRETHVRFLGTLPLSATVVTLMTAAIVCAILNPLLPAQDFRYSALLLIPFSYYVVQGILHTSKRFEYLGLFVCFGFIALSTLFYAFQ